MSTLIFTGGLQAVLPESLQSGAIQANSALYANLAKPLVATI
jgi:hypothetical protein